MSHRAEQKSLARAARKEAERHGAAAVARNRRATRLGVVAGVALVAFVALVVAGSGDGGGSRGGKDGSVAGTGESRAMLSGIAQDGTSLGDPKAPLVLTEFADMQCPFCRDYAVDVLPQIVERYVRTGKLRLELRLLRFVGPDSDRSARVMYAAADQDRMWSLADLFYRNQGTENTGYADDEFLRGIATAGGAPKAASAATTAQHEDDLTGSERQAQVLGIDSTPSFVIGEKPGTGKRLDVGDLSFGAFQSAIDAELAR